jgi:hypothetical protein
LHQLSLCGFDTIIRFTLETHAASLQQIISDWNENQKYSAARNGNMHASGTRTRRNCNPFLNTSPSPDDGVIDTLTGSSGQEWFLGTVG